MKKKISTLWGIMVLLVISVGVFVYVNNNASALVVDASEVTYIK